MATLSDYGWNAKFEKEQLVSRLLACLTGLQVCAHRQTEQEARQPLTTCLPALPKSRALCSCF